MTTPARPGPVDRLSYYLRFGLHVLLARPLPAIGGMSLTDACNLDCAHCWRKNQGQGHAPFDRVLATLDRLYGLGTRYLYLQGGEPFAWRDAHRRLADVVEAARQTGFFHVAVCTNGTFPLDAEPDSFSVSLEGLSAAHDRIRCGSFDRVWENIQASRHPKIFANLTLNRENRGELARLAERVAGSARLRGMVVNFHIPYPGVESLALSLPERTELALEAIRLKRRGYPILNSYGGLRSLARNDWKRPIDFSVVTDCRAYYTCCRARGNERICRECGYAGWAELSRIFAWDLSSVCDVLRTIHR